MPLPNSNGSANPRHAFLKFMLPDQKFNDRYNKYC